jgi:hypothetical protein
MEGWKSVKDDMEGILTRRFSLDRSLNAVAPRLTPGSDVLNVAAPVFTPSASFNPAAAVFTPGGGSFNSVASAFTRSGAAFSFCLPKSSPQLSFPEATPFAAARPHNCS